MEMVIEIVVGAQFIAPDEMGVINHAPTNDVVYL